jgi:methyl-accepting chemotaxis protein
MTEPNTPPINNIVNQIADQVDAIARFVGQTTELQVQTQMKLDRLTDTVEGLASTVDGLTVAVREQNTAINGYQEIVREQARSTAELIKLVTILSNRAS